MSFDDEIRKTLRDRLDPIGGSTEWEPMRARIAGARARRNRARTAIAGTVAACLAFGVFAVTWNGREQPVGPVSDPTPSGETSHIEQVPAVNARAALPSGRECPPDWHYFDNPALHYDVCYPEGWGFANVWGKAPAEVLEPHTLHTLDLISANGLPLPVRRRVRPREPGTLWGMFQWAPPQDCQGTPAPLPLDEGTIAQLCEGSVDSADSVSGPWRSRYVHANVPLREQPHLPGNASSSNLRVILEVTEEHWGQFEDVIFQILRSIRPYAHGAEDELSLPVRLVSSEGARLTLEVSPSIPCGSFSRFDVTESRSSVQIRAVGPVPVTVGRGGTAIPCPLPGSQQRDLELREPLGDRIVEFALVSPRFRPEQQLHGCFDFNAMPSDDPRRFGEPSRAISDALERHPTLQLDLSDLVEAKFDLTPPPPEDGHRSKWLAYRLGRTVGVFFAVYDGRGAPGWKSGGYVACDPGSYGWSPRRSDHGDPAPTS